MKLWSRSALCLQVFYLSSICNRRERVNIDETEWVEQAGRKSSEEGKLFRLSSCSVFNPLNVIQLHKGATSYLHLCPLIFRFTDQYTLFTLFVIVARRCCCADMLENARKNSKLERVFARRIFKINRSGFSEKFLLFFTRSTFCFAFVSVHSTEVFHASFQLPEIFRMDWNLRRDAFNDDKTACHEDLEVSEL